MKNSNPRFRLVRELVLTAAAVWSFIAAIPAVVHGQDLLDRLRSDRETEPLTYSSHQYRGRDRLDLRVGGRFPTDTVVPGDRGHARIGVELGLDSDFACGRFDVQANLKSLVSKEARDDYVETLIGAIESELMYNALVLACEISPTACSAYKHFRNSANAMLDVSYDRCQAIEAGFDDGLKSARAEAIKACVEQHRKSGASLEQALRACDKPTDTRGLLGDRTREFNLGREIEKAFDLEPGVARDMQALMSTLRVSPRGVGGEVRADPVLQEYRRGEREYQEAWKKVTDAQAERPGAPIEPEEMKALHPPGTPPPLPAEVLEIARIPASERRLLIMQLASRASLVKMTMRVHKLERHLAAAAQLPQNDDKRVREMKLAIQNVRRQLSHIKELSSTIDDYNRSLLGLSKSGQFHRDRMAGESIARAQSREWAIMKENLAAPVGSLRGRGSASLLTTPLTTRRTSGGSGASTTRSTVRGPGCTNCGFGEVNR